MQETERARAQRSSSGFDGPLVVTLEGAKAHGAAVLGGKGKSLARLVARGFPVPPAFVVTTAAFHAFARHNGVDTAIASLAAQRVPSEEAERVVRAIDRGTWPEPVRIAIESALAHLGDRTLAVRSSATDEDSADASFAGQHDTFLDVRGAGFVLDAIRRCYASLVRPEALRYRAERATREPPAMAIVVQTMIGADASGVAFTLHPVHHDASVVVVDLCAGLGDALVSGAKTPDHYVLTKADLSVVRRELAGAHAVLDDARVREIAELAVRIERELAAPQDVEWAIEGRKLWALQARPVTGTEAAPPSSELDTETDPGTTWTSANVCEVLPGVLSPLTRSLVLRDFDGYTREALARIGIRPQSKAPIVGSFYGRAYLNLTLSQEIGGQTATADKHYMGAEEEALRAKTKHGNTTAQLRLALALPKTLWSFSRLEAAIARADVLAATPFDTSSPDALTDRIKEHGAVHVLASIYGGAMFTILGKLTEKWLDDAGGELHGRLLRGLADMDSARPAYELWELARIALASPALRSAIEKADRAALDALPADENVRAFRDRLERFLRDHGHHSVQEMELGARTWDEDVTTVLAMIRNYLDGDDGHSPRAIEQRARADREAASAEAVDRLAAWQRPLFRYFLRRAQRWVPLREHTKSMLIKAMHERRRYLRWLGYELAARGLVHDASDIYYLTWDELRALSAGTFDRVVAGHAIRRRRIDERQHRLIELPDTFTGRPAPVAPDPAVVPDSRTLTGIAVSRGTVTGRARVILDPRSDTVIHPGEILVAPITDAGWTPLFTVAAGLVVDIGGALSHGSTVAREYGLPAVVNVKIATRVIRTGDTVTVDGTRGTVMIHPRQ